MAQPTISGMTLNAGTGGLDLAYDLVDSKAWQAVLVGFSTGDGTANVVMADTGLPVVAATGATWAATQSGTWNVGTVTTLTGITNNVTVVGTGTFAVQATLAAETTKVIGTVNVAAGQTIGVTGTFWQATQPVSVSGTVTAQGKGAENEAASTAVMLIGGRYDLAARTLDSTDVGAIALTANGYVITTVNGNVAVTGTFWQATQPISAASLPLPSGAATSALQGGGLPAALGAGGGLKVDGSGTALPISGTVTANAGTNLNTSALALESGGNLADCKTALQIIDDWDASDDCRVVPQSASAMDGATKCTIKRFMVVTSTDGATVIAAVASKKFRIRSLSVLATSATVTNFWLEDADGADVFGDSTGIPVQVTGASGAAGIVMGLNEDGWFQTATANKNLVVKLTAAQKVVISGTYIEVD